MKICWDNLEDLRLKSTGNFGIVGKPTTTLIYHDSCKQCGDPYLAYAKGANSKGHGTHEYCSIQCSNKLSKEERKTASENSKGRKNHFYGKTHTEETRKKMSVINAGEGNPMYGRKHSKETIEKMSGKNNCMYGLRGKDTPGYIHGLSYTKQYRAGETAKYRTKKSNQTSELTENEQKKVRLYYQIREYMGEDWHVDHIRPISKGGSDHPDNLQIIPKELNFRKSAQYPLSPELEKECEQYGFRI